MGEKLEKHQKQMPSGGKNSPDFNKKADQNRTQLRGTQGRNEDNSNAAKTFY